MRCDPRLFWAGIFLIEDAVSVAVRATVGRGARLFLALVRAIENTVAVRIGTRAALIFSGLIDAAIAVVGFSYGAYLAALLCEVRPVQWLALRSPASYPDEAWNVPKQSLEDHVDLDAYRREVQPADADRALRACARFGGDVLLAAAENDDVLPPQVMQSYRDALRSARSVTTRVLAGADHELSHADSRRQWSELLDAWLREMIIGARRQAAVLALDARAEAIERAEDPHRRG